MEFLYSPTHWVAFATLLFVVLVVYLKVPAMVTGALDARAKLIADELDAARKLREEGQALLASYQRRTANAQAEVQEIITRAQAEAASLAVEMKADMAAQFERRTKLAEEKIARAEVQAMQEVRGIAADVAIAAARKLITEQLSADKARTIVAQSIADAGVKLH